jgi:hypothetical protein
MTVTTSEQHTCKSCDNSFVGLYCNLCGEKVIEPKDRKFRTFISNVVIATSIVDNKFIKSLWLIISRPGFLSREYVDGRRVMYMRPLQLFFILNLIYFLFPVLQMFNSSLFTQKYILPHKAIVREVVAAKIKKDNMPPVAFELLYNEKTTKLAKLLIVIFVVIASLPLSLIFIRRNRYFTDHVALSVELTCFNLAVNTIFLSMILWPVNKILHLTGTGWEKYLDDLTLTVIFISTNLYFLYRAGRNFYQQKGRKLILKVVLGILGLFLALEAYKFILFFVTIWSL